MRGMLIRIGCAVLVVFAVAIVSAGRAGARPPLQSEDLIEHGRYLTTVAGCVGCHTPVGAQGQLDMSRAFAGGQPFELGPLGTVFSKNLTPDPETGLGEWTDEEIKTAIRTGRDREGFVSFPIMPYVLYNGMAEADLDAIVAFLRSLPPIENEVERRQILPPEALPQLSIRKGIVAPEPSDTAARGVYMMTAVIACTDCHTPVDPETGQPIREKYMAGGQPFEGPWGIVYGGNITPDKETGIGDWTDDDIRRVLHEGVRPDGRRVVLMPWQEFTELTDADTNAIIHYLRNEVPAVKNEVPAVALNEGFLQFAEVPVRQPNTLLIVAIVAAAMIIAAGGAFLVLRRRGPLHAR